jgi:hypothetical protein
MKNHKPFLIIVNDNTKEAFYSVDRQPIEKDEGKNAYAQACKLSMVLRSVPDPKKVLAHIAEVFKSEEPNDELPPTKRF